MIIDDFNQQQIGDLREGDIAFPNIEYGLVANLNLPRTTILPAYTVISNRVGIEYLEGLEWNNHGDIEWQNQILQHLYNEIFVMISNFRENSNNELLTKIFIWIQLWGGNAGRGIFVRGNGWPQNFNLETYLSGVRYIDNKQHDDALATINQLNFINTAFSTKHMHFWSNGNLPIYDSLIAAVIFGRRQVSANNYNDYLSALDNLITTLTIPNLTRKMIERNLFNWASTDQGQTWRLIRTNE